MVQATTPTFVCTLRDQTINLNEANNVYWTLRQGRTFIRKSGSALVIEGNVVSVYLTQDETLRLEPTIGWPTAPPALMQLNWTYPNGGRACSVVKPVDIGENLLKEVVE